jgi:hypothetical protein
VADEIHLAHAGQRGDAGLQGFVQMPAAAGPAGTHVEVGGQDLAQPLVHRIPEGRHHDGHGHRQRHAGQHPGSRHHRVARRRRQPGRGQPRGTGPPGSRRQPAASAGNSSTPPASRQATAR